MPPYQATYMPYAMHGYMPLYMAQEMDMKEDLQYLQEMFPQMAKRYAGKVSVVVDRMDYRGSMIYDEYPDRLRMQRLAHDISQMIEKEETAAAENETDAQKSAMDSRYREELVYVLLCYEIAKRRHGAGMDMSKFYGVSDI